jgi:WD40 repeat protein
MTGEATADQPSSEPILRIEAEQHTAAIKRIDTDQEQHFLVTGSDDKTARVWSLPDGQLLRILRPPSGDGSRGKVYAVAISPDAAIVAVGGMMWDKVVYLFERASGKVSRRLEGLGHPVNHLTFSRGGEYLAASIAGGGMRVWDTIEWELRGDASYPAGSYGCAFDRKGRLATTCDDGFLRLYEPLESGRRFRLIAEGRAPHGEAPGGIAFSPDGERVAVGYRDTTAVSILSSKDFTPVYLTERPLVDRGELSRVVWSADGEFVYGAGQYKNDRGCPIVRWDRRGRNATEFEAGANTVHDLQAWGAGVLFATSEPSFGGLGADGEKLLFRGPATPDMHRKQGMAFTVSGDGRSVRFGLEAGRQRPVRFDLDRRQVTSPAPADDGLTPATIPSRLHDWLELTEPRLGEKPLVLAPFERSLSVAAVPKSEHFVVGGDWVLYLFDARGNEVWQKGTPGGAWGVNTSADGRLAIAAYGDGTIRWHRISDGEELLAFFVHRDARRWLAWTPQGYYDASAGADDLIGWQVNRTSDMAADFFPVWLFRKRFARPDVVARVLETLDVDQALRAADEASGREPQPADVRRALRRDAPAIELLTPKDGSDIESHEIAVRYLLRHARRARKGEMWAVIDGQPERVTPHTERHANGTDVSEVALWVPPHDVTLALELRVGDFTTARSPEVHLRWTGAAPERRPSLYVLAVGVSRYKFFKPPLRYAHCDARDFAKTMLAQAGGMYEKVVPRILPNKEASSAEVLEGLQWLTDLPTSDDVAIVFLSGHGHTDVQGSYYFLTYNVEPSRLASTSVPQEMLARFLSKTKARKRILLVDSCHSGGAAGSGVGGGVPIRLKDHVNVDLLANELAHAAGALVLTSSTGTQVSKEDPAWKNGAFTEALLEGLAGEASSKGTREITVNALNHYVPDRVKLLTGGRQTAMQAFFGTNFAVALLPKSVATP